MALSPFYLQTASDACNVHRTIVYLVMIDASEAPLRSGRFRPGHMDRPDHKFTEG